MDMSIVNRQWNSRPDEERYVSLIDLHNTNLDDYHHSQTKIIDRKQLVFQPVADDTDGMALEVVREGGKPAGLTYWAFNQLAQDIEAYPSMVSKMPARLASDVLNWRNQTMPESKNNLLVTNKGNGNLIRAFNSEKYGRIWNYQLSSPLVDRFGDGLTGDWKVPSEFGKTEGFVVTKANTTLYRSERDMFVCLVDETNRIEIPNRRDGKSGSLARGFIVTNSEVGSGVIAIYFFTFDYLCSNRNIWGLGDVTEIKLRHTKTAPERWLDEIAPAIEAYGNQKASAYEQKLIAAQSMKIEGDKLDDFLKTGLLKTLPVVSNKMIEGIKLAHKAEENRPIETVWDAVTGITAYAKSIPFQNERVPVERASGKILELAVN